MDPGSRPIQIDSAKCLTDANAEGLRWRWHVRQDRRVEDCFLALMPRELEKPRIANVAPVRPNK